MTFATDDTITADMLNGVDRYMQLSKTPQSIANGGGTADFTGWTEVSDPGGWHTGSTITPPVGFYIVSSRIENASGASITTTTRIIHVIQKDGTTFAITDLRPGETSSSSPRLTTTGLAYFDGTEVLTTGLYQNSGSAKNFDCFLSAVRVTFA